MAKKRNPRSGLDHPVHSWAATYKIGKVITSNFNLEEVLSLVCKIACVVTKSHAASVILFNNSGSGMSAGGSFGISKNLINAGPSRFERIVVESLSSAKKPLLINDIENSPKFSCTRDEPRAESRGSALCTPVIFNRRFLAALVLYSSKTSYYREEQVKVSLALVCQIALAIQNYHLYTNMHMNYFNTIRSLVLAMEARDPYTKGHSERVTEYALIIADNIGLHPEQVQMIKYCGVLHDIGKIAISDTILNKSGPLTVSERSQIQRHPGEGAAVLSPLTFLRQGISLVKHHHERFDGTGYPDGLRGERIPMTARILACADAYDAMISDRPYRPRLTKEVALRELRDNSGTQFDPAVTSVFLKTLENIQERS